MAPDCLKMQSDLTEKDQYGGLLSLQIRCYDNNNCKEFTVTAPNFSVTKWLLLTVVFNILGYAFELHRQVIGVMEFCFTNNFTIQNSKINRNF